jgi:Acetyltransferase (GNAT) family
MSIREALSSDLDRIGELGSQSLKDGPYAGIIDDNPAQGRKFAEWMLVNGKILLAEEQDRVIGILGFVKADHHFSGQPYAAELMWYVEAESRPKYPFTTIALIRAAERIAREMGARNMVFTAPNEHVESLYKLCGYKKLETAYKKEL